MGVQIGFDQENQTPFYDSNPVRHFVTLSCRRIAANVFLGLIDRNAAKVNLDSDRRILSIGLRHICVTYLCFIHCFDSRIRIVGTIYRTILFSSASVNYLNCMNEQMPDIAYKRTIN